MAKAKKESTIWFKYTVTNCSMSRRFPNTTFDAQVTMISIESNSARVRLYLNGELITGNYDISATQLFEQLKIVPR